jgi:hypothetical protein
MMPRYPIYVPSRERYQKERAGTIRALQADGLDFYLVVEPSQEPHYRRWVAPSRLLVLPEDDFTLLGTRNWIRDHAERHGDAKHWQLDDNIWWFARLWEGRRIRCHVPLRPSAPAIDYERVPPVNEYGLALRALEPSKSPRIRDLVADYPDVLEAIRTPPDPAWRGLPAFRATPEPLKLAVQCRTEQDRDALVAKTSVTIDKRFKDKGWSAWFPPRGRDDPRTFE